MKRRFKKMMNNAWKSANEVIALLEEHQYEAVIVGGAVRDYLLQKKANDVDVATSALPTQVKAIFKKTVDIGIEHGTVLVIDFKEPIEVTTFRTEGIYSDHRRPDEVVFVRSLAEDLKRRDFTINAMAIRPDGSIVDLFNGQQDLHQHVIRAVGNPVERFTEDALRVIRGIRFSAQLNFKIEENTATAMVETAHFLQEIAVERIKVELDKIFTSQLPVNAFYHFEHLGIGQSLVGEFNLASRWRHFTPVTDAKIAWTYCSILAADFDVLKLYKCSNLEKQFVRNSSQCFEILQQSEPTKIQLFQYDTVYWQAAIHCYEAFYEKSYANKEQLFLNKVNLPLQNSSELAVSGKDLMAWRNKKGGPWLKEALNSILQRVILEQLPNDSEKIKQWFLTTKW